MHSVKMSIATRDVCPNIFAIVMCKMNNTKRTRQLANFHSVTNLKKQFGEVWLSKHKRVSKYAWLIIDKIYTVVKCTQKKEYELQIESLVYLTLPYANCRSLETFWKNQPTFGHTLDKIQQFDSRLANVQQKSSKRSNWLAFVEFVGIEFGAVQNYRERTYFSSSRNASKLVHACTCKNRRQYSRERALHR